MNLRQSKSICRQHRERATVLVIVLWTAIGLISIALYFANSMSYELRASDNRVSGLETEQAIEGAARYISYVLYTYATNGAVPVNTQFAAEAVPVGDAHFWIIGRDPSDTPSSEPYFGIVDEASKLNLNTVDTNTLSYLPNMTTDFADAIMDWRSTNGGGLYSMNYDALGYQDKNAPFETVDELRLVYGATIDLLAGNDANRNGVLDANEKTANGSTEVEPGLFEYCTVYTREPNFLPDGTMLTNVNMVTEQDMESLFENAGVANGQTVAESIFNQIHVPAGRNGTTYAPCNGLLDFCYRCRNAGMTSDDFAKIAPNVTTSTSAYIRGRVNIDTANAVVLTALFMGVGTNQQIDQSTAQTAAQTMITYRQQNPDSMNSVAWIVDALGISSPVITALRGGDYITSRSYQFSADIAAVGPFGRGYRRVKFIFDTSDGTPIIIYRQDLSRLGWALGDKARQTWVANASNNE